MALESGVAALVLLSAVLHAGWNAVVKVTGDRLLALATVMTTGSALALCALPFVPIPAPASWPYLVLSMALHAAYQTALLLSYRVGDLSHVYPIARGVAPLPVAALAAGFAGEALSGLQIGALLLVSLGIASLALAHGWPTRETLKPVGFAVLTGLVIGSYSFVDGQGVRLAGSARSYIVWQFALAGLPIFTVAVLRRRRRVLDYLGESGRSGVLAGLFASVAYAIVMWALGQGGMANVVALRETSVIFGALFGARLLGEPFGGRRVTAAAVVATGVMLLNLAR
ncbi:MAG: EamA family transporter [Deltaproteobacteria bacterium]|nr:MAG: EamA family transporter [Deltaproteobacteria bacterium]